MEINFLKEDKVLIFKIKEEIDDCTAQEIRRKVDHEIERYMPKKVIFDFNNVIFMDSSGIGLLMGRYKFTQMLGVELQITNITPNVKKILEMSGILKLIPIIQI